MWFTQRCNINMTVIEGQKLKEENNVQWSGHVKKLIRTSSSDGRNTSENTLFIRNRCVTWMHVFQQKNERSGLHLTMKHWPQTSIEYRSMDFATLAKKYEAVYHPNSIRAINSQYAEFRHTMKQKLKQGSVAHTFLNMVAAALVKMWRAKFDHKACRYLCYISSIHCKFWKSI